MSSLSMSLNHLVACFLSTAGLLLSTHALGADTPPNIILIITDDQGYGDLACHGNPHIKTPQLDRLFRESTRLTDFHVSPTCAPTRSALMTGRHEFKNGISHTINERERLRLDAKILPQVLKQAGYTTGIFGKWHLGDEAPYQPEQRGFDEVFIHGAGGIGQTYPEAAVMHPETATSIRSSDITAHLKRLKATAPMCSSIKPHSGSIKCEASHRSLPTSRPMRPMALTIAHLDLTNRTPMLSHLKSHVSMG